MGSRGRVAIIDDELNICTSLSTVLQGQGYDVNYFTSSKNGVEAIKKNDYDVIISDIKMAEIDGIEVLRQLKEHDADSVVIMITAYPSSETVTAALRLGAYDYITKPFDVNKITFVMERATSYRRLLRVSKDIRKKNPS